MNGLVTSDFIFSTLITKESEMEKPNQGGIQASNIQRIPFKFT